MVIITMMMVKIDRKIDQGIITNLQWFDDLTGMRPMILMICGSFDQDEIFHYDDLSSVARWQRGLQGLDDDPHWRIHSLFSHADRAQR